MVMAWVFKFRPHSRWSFQNIGRTRTKRLQCAPCKSISFGPLQDILVCCWLKGKGKLTFGSLAKQSPDLLGLDGLHQLGIKVMSVGSMPNCTWLTAQAPFGLWKKREGKEIKGSEEDERWGGLSLTQKKEWYWSHRIQFCSINIWPLSRRHAKTHPCTETSIKIKRPTFSTWNWRMLKLEGYQNIFILLQSSKDGIDLKISEKNTAPSHRSNLKWWDMIIGLLWECVICHWGKKAWELLTESDPGFYWWGNGSAKKRSGSPRPLTSSYTVIERGLELKSSYA